MLTLEQVMEVLNANRTLVYALLRSGELRGLRMGGRGIWRISEDDLQSYLDAAYAATAEYLRENTTELAEPQADED